MLIKCYHKLLPTPRLLAVLVGGRPLGLSIYEQHSLLLSWVLVEMCRKNISEQCQQYYFSIYCLWHFPAKFLILSKTLCLPSYLQIICYLCQLNNNARNCLKNQSAKNDYSFHQIRYFPYVSLHEWLHCDVVVERYGVTDSQALYNYDLMTRKTILTYRNHISDDHMPLIDSASAGISHSPLSNLYFCKQIYLSCVRFWI